MNATVANYLPTTHDGGVSLSAFPKGTTSELAGFVFTLLSMNRPTCDLSSRQKIKTIQTQSYYPINQDLVKFKYNILPSSTTFKYYQQQHKRLHTTSYSGFKYVYKSCIIFPIYRVVCKFEKNVSIHNANVSKTLNSVSLVINTASTDRLRGITCISPVALPLAEGFEARSVKQQ